jgi:hypothetical protein
MTWEILISEEYEEWFCELPQKHKLAITTDLKVLHNFGPMLGRPHVDQIKGSKYPGFRCGDFSIALQQLPLEWENREVEIGFRPEDVKMGTQSGLVIHARVGKSNMTLRYEKDAPIRAGDNITFSVRPSGLHVFSDGKRVGGFQKADAFSNSADSP